MRSQENYDNVKDDDDEDDDNTGASAFAAAKLGITPPSFSSAESTDTANAATTLSHPKPPTTPLEDPVLVYHDSARSIVFRDHLRRSLRKSENNTTSSLLETIQDDDAETDDMAAAPASSSPQQQQQQAVDVLMLSPTVPKIVPLAPLELGPQDEFLDLLDSQWTTTTNHALDAGDDTSVVSEQPHPVEWTAAERDVCTMLRNQQCTVKTLKNSDWHDFLNRFLVGVPTTSATVNATIRGANTPSQRRFPREHDDIPPATAAEHDTPLFPFNSFVTSTTLLPKDGLRMRCYGSTTQYTTGIVFALPVRHNKKRSNNNNTNNEEEEQDEEVTEDDAVARTQTWSWPAGYSVRNTRTLFVVIAGNSSFVSKLKERERVYILGRDDSKWQLGFGVVPCGGGLLHTYTYSFIIRLSSKTLRRLKQNLTLTVEDF